MQILTVGGSLGGRQIGDPDIDPQIVGSPYTEDLSKVP